MIARMPHQDRVAHVATRMGETNDCAVRALALVLRISYETAHSALERAGREFQDGTPRGVTETAIALLGFRIRRRWSPTRLALVTGRRGRPSTAHALLDPEAWAEVPDMLLFVHRHVAALVDSKVEDWTQNHAAPIEEGWELMRISDTVVLGEKLPSVIHL